MMTITGLTITAAVCAAVTVGSIINYLESGKYRYLIGCFLGMLIFVVSTLELITR